MRKHGVRNPIQERGRRPSPLRSEEIVVESSAWPLSSCDARLEQAAYAVDASAVHCSGTKDFGELVCGRDLELVVAAFVWPLVSTPAQECGRVSEAVALQVVVLHLAHPLDPQRFP